jgi:hypothetical protein
MAFDGKYQALLALRPDIAIIPESAHPDVLQKKACKFLPSSKHWHGGNDNKGLSVFTFGDYSAEVAKEFSSSLHWIIPLRIEGPYCFNLLAVWAKHPSADKGRMAYRGPVLDALDLYREFLSERESVIAGDFNNNVVWDKPGKAINHVNAVQTVKSRHGLISAYHQVHGCSQGREKHPTLFWQHNRSKTYHVDHCFVPESWIKRGLQVVVGSADDWLGLSDHAPFLAQINE